MLKVQDICNIKQVLFKTSQMLSRKNDEMNLRTFKLINDLMSVVVDVNTTMLSKTDISAKHHLLIDGYFVEL